MDFRGCQSSVVLVCKPENSCKWYVRSDEAMAVDRLDLIVITGNILRECFRIDLNV